MESAEPSKTAVSVREVSYSYDGHRALDSLSLTIQAGEMVCVIGPNGSGKTTLFGLLNTRLYPQSGNVQILGRETKDNAVFVRSHIGCVFQAPALDARLSVKDNLVHHGRLFGMTSQGIHQRVSSDLAQLGLTARANDRVKTLSGGLMRRVELARALLTDPSILIMDEPTVGLDPSARDRFWELVGKVRSERQVTIIYTTHWLDEAQPADRVAIIDKGNLVAYDTLNALRHQIKGRVVTLRGTDAQRTADRLTAETQATVVADSEGIRVVFENEDIEPTRILSMIGDEIESIEIAQPSLGDVFRQLTGHEFEADQVDK